MLDFFYDTVKVGRKNNKGENPSQVNIRKISSDLLTFVGRGANP
jgi:hypothetical protein